MELKEQLSVGEVVEAYQRAWSAPGPERRRLLELAMTEDAELVQPNGRSVGRDAVAARIAGLGELAPDGRLRRVVQFFGSFPRASEGSTKGRIIPFTP